MTNEAAHEQWWRQFEVVAGLSLLLAIGLQFAVPWSLPRGRLAPVLVSSGIALVIWGVVLVARGRSELRRSDQPTDPGRPTRELVTTGVYAFSRNPLYLGGIATLLGLALVLDLPWLIVLLPPAVVACHVILIAPEERYLAGRFGETYRSYAAGVGRWLGRKW